jgi:hypothetical protein
MVRFTTQNGLLEFEDRLLTAEILKNQQVVDAAAKAEAEVTTRTYHMGSKQTLGLDYDDRLTTRLKCSLSTAYAYLELAVHQGGLRHARLGKKYLVTELAVREFLGDIKAAA